MRWLWRSESTKSSPGKTKDDLGGDRFLMPFMGAHFGMRHRWNNSWTGEGTLASVPASGPIAEGSGTGVLFYDTREFPETHRNVFYRADWLRGAVEIFRRDWQGAMLVPAGGRVEPFVSLGDKKPLFRPTGMAVGPDGALWIGGWGSTYGWNGDKTEGRVFRISAEGGPTLAAAVAKLDSRPAIEKRSAADVAVDFDSPIMAMRGAAQDELLRRASGGDSQAAAARREIAELAAAAIKEPGREARQTWLLWTLGRIAADDTAGDAFFTRLVEAKDAAISETNRIQAVRILAHRVADRSGDARRLPPCVIASLADPAPRVRFAAMLAAANVVDRAAVPAIIDAATGETDRLVHYAAWTTLRALVPPDELRGLLDRVPAVATSLGVPTPKLAEPRPPANTDAVLGRLKDADPARGAKLFADARGANCAACHRAGDHGVGGIGPELSDIGLRAAPAAIVESILQPSATIIEGYRVSTLVLDDGRSLTGLVLDDTPDTLRVIDAEGRSTSVRKDAIEERAVQQVSLMPAGYDRTLTPEELADLVAFLLTQKRPAGQVAAAP